MTSMPEDKAELMHFVQSKMPGKVIKDVSMHNLQNSKFRLILVAVSNEEPHCIIINKQTYTYLVFPIHELAQVIMHHTDNDLGLIQFFNSLSKK